MNNSSITNYNGTDGTNGTNGTNGDDGTNGVSVISSVESAGANCAAGGSKFVSSSGTTYACNSAPAVEDVTFFVSSGGTA